MKNFLLSEGERRRLLALQTSPTLQGDSGGLGLGYVDINSVSFGGYPETELSQHNPVRDHQNHPVVLGL